MTGWFKFPDEDIIENRVDLKWEGPGWYCTTRIFPGSELYHTWYIPDQDGLDDSNERDRASRSYGGTVQYLSDQMKQDEEIQND